MTRSRLKTSPLLNYRWMLESYKLTLVDDNSRLFKWINEAFPIRGTSVSWEESKLGRTVKTSETDPVEFLSTFDTLLRHLGIHPDEGVFAFCYGGYGSYDPAALMSVETCRDVLGVILRISRGETYFAAPDSGWLIEYDPFFDELSGGRAQSKR